MEFDPDLVGMLEAEIKAGEHAVSAAMKTAGNDLKQAWRQLSRSPARSLVIACRERSEIGPIPKVRTASMRQRSCGQTPQRFLTPTTEVC